MGLSAPDAVVLAVLGVTLGAATAVDLKCRRIPNSVSVATSAAGLALAATGASGLTLTSSIAGFVIGLVLMLPGHVLGAMGAGDVKLFAAAGTVLGAPRTIEAFLFVAIAGGVLALGIALARGRFSQTLLRTAALCGRPAAARVAIESPTENNRFAYGPAIAVGCVLAVLW